MAGGELSVSKKRPVILPCALGPQAYKVFTLILGISPSREFYVRIFQIERHDEWIGPKRDVKPIQLLRGHARLPHRIQVIINDFFASGDGLIGVGKDAMIVLLAFIHVMAVVINQYSIFWHSFSFLRGGRWAGCLNFRMSTRAEI